MSEEFAREFKYKDANKEISFEIPEHIGIGKYNRIILNRDLEIYSNSIKPKKNIEMSGITKGEIFLLAICTGENIEWTEYNSNTELRMNTGEGILYQVNDIKEVCNFIPNHHYKGISIIIKPDKFKEFISSISFDKSIFNKDYKNFKINKFVLPVESKIVIKQIFNCPYNNNVKNIYLEGKIIELISICLNNIIDKEINHMNTLKLSKTDLQSLYRAKEILDNSISSPITLTELSRLVCLNELKLKTGFKQVFGKPVYTYLLDKRMELARIFLEIHHISVNEVAQMVGYSSSSGFSKAFSKRYGFSPSDCFSSIR